jgi:transcriptional regulator with XRE-family HTH domain
MSSAELGRFLRAQRERLRPEDFGLRSRTARRTRGLRREEVAVLAGMSADYYRRLEQARVGPPSSQVLEAVARALRFTDDERDYAFRIVDRDPPRRPHAVTEIEPALAQMLDAMPGAAAMVMSDLGETLAQNATSKGLLGDHSLYTGINRNGMYRWFTDPAERLMHPPEAQEAESDARVSTLRGWYARTGDPRAERLVTLLRAHSTEFDRLWLREKVHICRSGPVTLLHPVAGTLDLYAQILQADGPGQLLVTFTAPQGSSAAARLSELGGESLALAGT